MNYRLIIKLFHSIVKYCNVIYLIINLVNIILDTFHTSHTSHTSHKLRTFVLDIAVKFLTLTACVYCNKGLNLCPLGFVAYLDSSLYKCLLKDSLLEG